MIVKTSGGKTILLHSVMLTEVGFKNIEKEAISRSCRDCDKFDP